MNRRAKKARAKRRSEQYRAEKVVAALDGRNPKSGMPGGKLVLRHGKSWTFENDLTDRKGSDTLSSTKGTK